MLNDSWYIKYIWWLTIKRAESFWVFHKFCNQRKLLFLYKIQKSCNDNFSNVTSGLHCHNFIQSWICFIVMVSTILLTNMSKRLEYEIKSATMSSIQQVQFVYVVWCLCLFNVTFSSSWQTSTFDAKMPNIFVDLYCKNV